MNKKGFALVLSLPVLIIGAIIILALLGGTGFIIWLLARNIIAVAGVLLILLLLFVPQLRRYTLPIIITGAVLIAIPTIFKGIGMPLGAVLP